VGALISIPGLVSQIGFVLFALVLFALISGVGGYIAKSWGEPIQKTLSLFKSLRKT
jgi:hypothetical protein